MGRLGRAMAKLLNEEPARPARAEALPPVVKRIYAPAWVQWLDEAREMLGERGFPVGTVRTWKGDDFIKTRDRGWVPAEKPDRAGDAVVQGPGDTIGHKDYLKNMERSAGAVKAHVDAGTLPHTFEHQVKTANTVVAKHKARFGKFMDALKDAAPKGADVSGRVKTVQSTLGKLALKPKYKTAEGMQDVTGTRIVCNDTAEVKKTVENLKKRFKVVGEDDYITSPKKGDVDKKTGKPSEGMHYRSHHLIVQDDDGSEKEIQVRTKRQDTFGHFAHEAYKPTTPEKRAAIEQHGDEIEKYARDVSDHFARLDNGEQSEEPEAPEIVKKTFGKIEHHG